AASLWSLPSRHCVLVLLVCFRWSMSPAPAANYTTEANVMVEIPLQAKQSYTDPFNELNVDIVFTDPKGRELQVPAYWAGGNLWKVRYASPVIGRHRFISKSSDSS